MILRVSNLTCGYEARPIIKDLSFELKEGQYLCVVGENGAGKSTLVKTLIGLIPPLSGEIETGEGCLGGEIGYLPQHASVQRDFPASVKEIVLSGTLNTKGFHPFYTATDRIRAARAMKRLDLTDMARECFRNLSGGQQQRVLLARAFCATRKLLVLDEPVAGLDPRATSEMYDIVKRINQEDGITVVMVSHDVCCAVAQASHVLHLGHHTRFCGTVEEYRTSDVGRSFLAAAGVIHHLQHRETT
jgi:zinc transport system ATP-binding protein